MESSTAIQIGLVAAVGLGFYFLYLSSQTKAPAAADPNKDADGYTNCAGLKTQYGIIPNQSWGTADETIQKVWIAHSCT